MAECTGGLRRAWYPPRFATVAGGTVEPMSALAGPVFAAALLLVAAGVVKVARPDTTRIALRTAGLPSRPWAARLIGVGELLVAGYALLAGGRAGTLLIAGAYAGFALFAERLRRMGRGRVSCGCFGTSSAPVSTLHVGVNLVIVAVAGVAAIRPPAGAVTVARATPLGGVVFAGFTLMLAWLVLVLLTAVPELLAATRPSPVAPATRIQAR